MAVTLDLIRRITIVANTQGVDAARRELDQLVATQDKAAATAGSMSSAQSTAGASALSAARQFEQLERRIDPVARAQHNLAREQGIVARALNEGAITSEQAARATLLLGQRHAAAIPEMNKAGKAVALNSYQLQNLGFQLNDIATMLMMGSSPFQIMASQGGQVAQILQSANGGVSGALKDIGGRMLGLLTPARLAGGAIAGIAVAGYAAWSAWDDRLRQVQISLNGVGRASGQTVDSLAALAQRTAGPAGMSISQSLTTASGFAGVGIGGENIAGLTAAARPFGRAFGMSVEDAAAELAKAFADPSRGAQELNKRLGFLSYTLQEQIRQQQAVGDLEGARATLLREVNSSLGQTTTRANGLSDAFSKVTTLFSNAWTRFGQAFAAPTAQEQLEGSLSRQSRRGVFTFNPGRRDELLGQEIMRNWEKVFAEFGAAQKAMQDAEANRLSFIEAATQRMREDGELAIRSVTARTLAERMAVDADRARIETLRQTGDATRAALAAEQSRNQALAEATRQLQDAARDARNQSALVGLRPFERTLAEIDQRFRDRGDRLTTGGGGAAPARASGLNSSFQQQLSALMAAVPGITITSGFRTRAEQADLYARKPHLAAPPGRSNHEYGLAADLAYATPAARAAAHQRAGEFGLRFPMGHEPWHIEPVGARAMRNGGGGAPASGSVLNQSIRDQERIDALRAASIGPLREANDAIAQQNQLLDMQSRNVGRTTAEIESANEAQRLYSQLARDGLTESTVTAQFGADAWAKIAEQIRNTATAAGDLAARRENFQEMVQTMDGIRGAAGGFMSTFTSGLMNGKSAIESLREATRGLLNTLMQMATNQLLMGLFGKQGTPGGGIMGSLLSSFLGGGGGGGMGIGGLYANGAAFDGGRITPFATGGVVHSPTLFPMANGTGLMGEAGPEAIMPLRRGPDGRLGVTAARPANNNTPSGHGGGVSVTVINNSQAKVETRQRREPDGRQMLQFILSEVKAEYATGGFDDANRARFGRAPKGVAR